jgi:hypothetical protein
MGRKRECAKMREKGEPRRVRITVQNVRRDEENSVARVCQGWLRASRWFVKQSRISTNVESCRGKYRRSKRDAFQVLPSCVSPGHK